MKSIVLHTLSIVTILALTLIPAPTSVSADSVATAEPFRGASVCMPGAEDNGGCLNLGPAQTLAEWAQKGISYPNVGLPAYTPDASMNEMPYQYASIQADPRKEVRLFPSLDDAIATSNQSGSIPAGAMRWVAYVSRADVDGNHYVQIPDSFEWVRASPAEINFFQGLAFYHTPDHEFGWIIDQTYSRSDHSLEAPQTGNHYYRNQMVNIYDVQMGNEQEWYQIGVNEWIERRAIRKVTINTTPPQGVTGDRWIEVNLYEQTLTVYEKGQLVFGTLIASGADPFFTKPGVFQIREKKDTEKMTGAFESDGSDYYSLDKVPWTMYFDGARALHAAYWRALFGYPQSHGCVNLSPGDAHYIYNWANVGDFVYVWDPSGQTPTDPSKYGEGGA